MMIREAISLKLVIVGTLLTLPAFAQQALVRNFEIKSLEIGQAYLAHYGERCLAILPSHVVEEAGAVAALLREGSAALLGETSDISELGDDLSVADLIGGITENCGYSTLAISRAVDRRISANAIASIRSVNGDGTIAQLSVTIVDDDGSMFLRVQPTNSATQIRKGHSGSMLMAGDTPIGMLLSVDARFGVGKVIRLDAMLGKLDGFLRNDTNAPTSTASALQPSARRVTTAAVTSWSVMAASAQHRAVNLFALDNSPPWIANVDKWPVELEIEIPGERMAIVGIELDATDIATANRPESIELFVSGTADGRRWRSVAGGRLTYVEGKTIIKFAPSWARHIKLKIVGSETGSGLISLYRLRILAAD